MLDQPSMIKRPVLDLGGGKLLVGFKPEPMIRLWPRSGTYARTRSVNSPANSQRAPPHPIMAIDSFTVLLFGLLIKIVLGAMFMVFWMRNRSAPWFAWWSATLLVGAVTSSLYIFFGADNFISVGLGNATLVALRLLLAGRARVRSSPAVVGCAFADAGALARGVHACRPS